MAETMKHHPEYYILGADLYILVDIVLFRIHSYFFLRESDYWRKTLAGSAASHKDQADGLVEKGTSSANPIVIGDEEPEDFARFISVFYNPKFEDYSRTKCEDWAVILRIAAKWEFHEVKNLAIRHLETHEKDPIKRLLLYQNSNVHGKYLLPLYLQLASRDEPLTLEEVRALGIENSLLLQRARESLRYQVTKASETETAHVSPQEVLTRLIADAHRTAKPNTTPVREPNGPTPDATGSNTSDLFPSRSNKSAVSPTMECPYINQRPTSTEPNITQKHVEPSPYMVPSHSSSQSSAASHVGAATSTSHSPLSEATHGRPIPPRANTHPDEGTIDEEMRTTNGKSPLGTTLPSSTQQAIADTASTSSLPTVNSHRNARATVEIDVDNHLPITISPEVEQLSTLRVPQGRLVQPPVAYFPPPVISSHSLTTPSHTASSPLTQSPAAKATYTVSSPTSTKVDVGPFLDDGIRSFNRRTLPLIASAVFALVCQVYRFGHLFLPSLYFSRVDQLLNESELTAEEIAYITVSSQLPASTSSAQKLGLLVVTNVDEELGYPKIPPLYGKLKLEWDNMINNFVEEWRTLTIISAMLVPSILTLFQIDNAANDPVTRSLAFWSMILALWSLVYCCLYIIQFRRMRSQYTLVAWALEAQSNNSVFWNTWVMLALPSITLAWSVLIFMAAVIWFMWRTRANISSNVTLTASPATEFAFRIVTCTFFVISMIYFVLAVVRSFEYGTRRTGQRKKRITGIVGKMEARLKTEKESKLDPTNRILEERSYSTRESTRGVSMRNMLRESTIGASKYE